MKVESITIRPGARLRFALILAVLADALQIVVFPLFVIGAESPVDDLLDLGMAGALTYLLGWQWEFLPSFFVKLVPGVDLAPLWTLAVANVYRKSRRIAIKNEEMRQQQPPANDPRNP